MPFLRSKRLRSGWRTSSSSLQSRSLKPNLPVLQKNMWLFNRISQYSLFECLFSAVLKAHAVEIALENLKGRLGERCPSFSLVSECDECAHHHGARCSVDVFVSEAFFLKASPDCNTIIFDARKYQ